LKVDFTKLDRAFNPRCVAVVGDSDRDNFRWLRAVNTLKGKFYSVHVNPKTIEAIKALGIENYTSLLDIPEPVDLAIVAVPRTAALDVLEDCIRKEVATAHFFTSGFSEMETEEGIELEKLFTKKAEEANFHLIGPNCLGIFNPKIGLKQNAEQYIDSAGSLGFISQSGNHGINFSIQAHLQGVDINKAVSFGNGIVLDSTDFLEYFGRDPEIKVIGMYLEGVKDGRRFLKVLKEVSSQKPVVIWKGGRTEEGGRAIASHTGSLAGSQTIWNVALRQYGAIKVATMEELIDTLKALIYLPPIQSNKVGIAGGSGGQSVAIADAFAEAGLKVPRLTKESYDEFATFFSLIGGGYNNPIDTGNPNRTQMRRIMGILERDANVDNLVMVINTIFRGVEEIEANVDVATDTKNTTSKPLMVIFSFCTPDKEEIVREGTQKLQNAGIPVFSTMERGALALRNAWNYYHLKNSA